MSVRKQAKRKLMMKIKTDYSKQASPSRKKNPTKNPGTQVCPIVRHCNSIAFLVPKIGTSNLP